MALLNRPWFKQKRGGAKIKAEKEGRTYRETCKGGEGKPAPEPEVEERCRGKVNEVEGVLFVPHTPASKLKEALQTQDEVLAQALGLPSLRFVEKSGTTILEDVGQSDPWAGEQYCGRKECWHCCGRPQLLSEAEERTVSKVTGEKARFNPPEDCRTSLPGCTTDGINYVLE